MSAEMTPFSYSYLAHKYIPAASIIPPWPISPNMTPNLNGNIPHAKSPGFISLYLGIP